MKDSSKPQASQHGNTLWVFAAPTPDEGAPDMVRVYWRTGTRKFGAIDIRLDGGCQKPSVAAELVAVRYLLGTAAVLGRNKTGRGLRLVFSTGAVRRLLNKKMVDKRILGYGLALSTRYAEAEYGVSKDTSWFPPDMELAALGGVPRIDAADFDGPEMVDAGEVGRIAITGHALERYRAYTQSAGSSRAWASLAARLKRALVCKPIKDSVTRHKLIKYGELPEIWGHPDSEMNFVLCPGLKGHKTLVTVFQRNPSEDVPVFVSAVANR